MAHRPSQPKPPPGVKEYRVKLVVVGSPGVGKTSLIKRYVNNAFSNAYKATVGADFAQKVIDIDKTRIHLQIWDIAGQERFGTMTKVYYRNATAAMIVYDILEKKTFESVENWRKDIKEKLDDEAGDRIPILLVGNKTDALNRELEAGGSAVPHSEAEEYVAAQLKAGMNFIGFQAVSARENAHVVEAFAAIVQAILAYVKAQEQTESSDEEPKTIKLGDEKEKEADDTGCACFGGQSHQAKFGQSGES